jgi:hypothetical protein
MANTRYKKRKRGGDNLGNHLFDTAPKIDKISRSPRSLETLYKKANHKNEYLILKSRLQIDLKYLIFEYDFIKGQNWVIAINLETMVIEQVEIRILNISSGTDSSNYQFGSNLEIDQKLMDYFKSKNARFSY